MGKNLGRPAATRLATICLIALAGASIFLTACQTVSQSEYQTTVDALVKAQLELESARAQQNLQTEALAAKDGQIAALDKKNTDQESRLKELESTVTRLENLLNDLQSLQLDRMMPKPEPALEMTQTSGDSVEAASANAAAQNSDTALANPAGGPASPILLEASAQRTVPPASPPAVSLPETPVIAEAAAAPLPDLNTDIIPATDLSPAATRTVSSSRLGGGLGHDLLTRVERTKLRGTPLFSERDSASGRYYYYHQDAWYDRPGIFMEFNRALGGKYSARLILQIPDADPSNLASERLAVAVGQPLGTILEARALSDGSTSYQYLALNYDAALATALRQALDAGSLSVAITHPDGSTSPKYTPDLVMRQALRDMMEAREDLR